MAKEKAVQGRTIDSFQKIVKDRDSIKHENAHLREDIKRMQAIVNEMCQKRLSTDITDKHFLGKPMKESSMWFPQNLVGEVEFFLKKEQVGNSSKRFINNLVKFISKYASTSHQSKAISSSNSRAKTSGKSSHARSASMYDPGYSTSMCDMGTSSIKKTHIIGMTGLKKSLLISKYKKIDSRKYTSNSLLMT
jgi:hypothetical protein